MSEVGRKDRPRRLGEENIDVEVDDKGKQWSEVAKYAVTLLRGDDCNLFCPV